MTERIDVTPADENGVMFIGGIPCFEVREVDPSCPHKEFETIANILRLSEEDDGDITGFKAGIDIRCKQCRGSFRFLGLPSGNDPYEPTCGMFGIEGRFPIKPFTGPEQGDDGPMRYALPVPEAK